MEESPPNPPRNGEGDQPKAGGGVLAAPRKTTARARSLRRDMSLPEVLLWQQLRKKPAELKFRRQFPLGRFVFDFACLEARILTEIDGEAHNRGSQPVTDEIKNAAASAAGFHLIRFPATNILNNLDGVIQMLVAICAERRPLHRPADGPPPRAGEDFL